MIRGGEQGFAFVEAMVAVAMIAAAAAALSQIVTEEAGRTRSVATDRAALLVAQSRLAAAGRDAAIRPGFSSGRDGPFVWNLRITPYQPGQGRSSAGELYLVAVAVRPAGASSDAVTLRSLRLAPPG